MRGALGGLLAVGLAFLPGHLLAQEPAGPAAASLLRKAAESGALSRVLGSRWFEDETGSVVRARGEKLEGGALRFTVEFLPVAAMREERTTLRCEVGADGLVRSVESELVRGEERMRISGQVKDGRLAVKLEPGGEAHESAWPQEALPLPLLAFVLPALCDQGLPERLVVRAFHGFDKAVEERAGSFAWAAKDATWVVEMRDLAPGQAGSRVVADPASGAFSQVVIGGMRMKPISVADGEEKTGKKE